ncbi:MAG: hypothetical protein KatS3mg031_3043 [Chitinophagales bacterium]|nr:MAG: hypothetical protein KatS3mg031_3043 [Chitinophagales bacterium]
MHNQPPSAGVSLGRVKIIEAVSKVRETVILSGAKYLHLTMYGVS